MGKVIIFGARTAAPRCLRYALEQGHEILCFLDNDPVKGKTIALEAAGGGAELAFIPHLTA